MYESWPAPLSDGGTSEEMAFVTDGDGKHRLLILAPLFDEANKLRRLLNGIAEHLSEQKIASVIPDLPGWNESLAPQSSQTLSGWKKAAQAAASHFKVTHILGVRTAAILAPQTLPGWLYAPAAPAQALKVMARAQSLSEGEMGNGRSASEIIEIAAQSGGLIAGWNLGPPMIRELRDAAKVGSESHQTIEHSVVGGSPPWLRSEPTDSPEQAAGIAAIIANGLSDR